MLEIELVAIRSESKIIRIVAIVKREISNLRKKPTLDAVRDLGDRVDPLERGYLIRYFCVFVASVICNKIPGAPGDLCKCEIAGGALVGVLVCDYELFVKRYYAVELEKMEPFHYSNVSSFSRIFSSIRCIRSSTNSSISSPVLCSKCSI